MIRRPRRPTIRAVWRWSRQRLGLPAGLLLLGLLLRSQTSAFARPEALVGLLMVAVAGCLLAGQAAWRQADRTRLLAAPQLAAMGEPSLGLRQWQKAVLLLAALALLVLAAARPKGRLAVATVASEGIDLAVVVDVSNSMRVTDLDQRSRLQVAKELVGRFIDSSAGDRLALVAFAGSAHVLCPFTSDTATVSTFLEDLDYGSVAQQGTQLGEALRVALARFDPRAECGQALLLLTDGEDQGSQPLEQAADARRRGVVVHTVGLGTTTGATIPLYYDLWGNPVVKRYQGQPVTSKLDEPLLRRIAALTGGRYFRATSAAQLAAVLADIAAMEQTVSRAGKVELREDLYAWYLFPAMLLLALEPLLRLRRPRGKVQP